MSEEARKPSAVEISSGLPLEDPPTVIPWGITYQQFDDEFESTNVDPIRHSLFSVKRSRTAKINAFGNQTFFAIFYFPRKKLTAVTLRPRTLNGAQLMAVLIAHFGPPDADVGREANWLVGGVRIHFVDKPRKQVWDTYVRFEFR